MKGGAIRLFLFSSIMNETKTISKKNRVNQKDKSILDRMIRKNPNLKTLIDKLDLEIIKTENHEHKQIIR